MGNHIVRAELDIYSGVLRGTMEFTPGLNIISGENGTLKTRILQALKGGAAKPMDPSRSLNIQAISPKRNSERRAAEGILQYFRQQNRTWEHVLNERIGSQINDTTFDNYPSLGDFFYLVHDHRSKDGGDRRNHMGVVTAEFNEVIRSVFPHYALVADWDSTLGAPRIRMRKHGSVEFPIESLSLGEQEVLSLVASMNAAKDTVDVYLIDEPEVHLNWHLEERLFQFIDSLCESHGKQAIVVTHSRTIFKPQFLPKAQFLYWSPEGTVAWNRTLSPAAKSRLAGDAIEIVALGEFTKPTLFVEDASQRQVISALASGLNISVTTSECGNASNVKSLFAYQKEHGRWPNTLFVVDGDGQGNPFPGDPQFIHLPYYCIENALIDPGLLATVASKSVVDVQGIIVELIRAKRALIFRKNKFFEFLADAIEPRHASFERLAQFDASIILRDLVARIGLTQESFLEHYIAAAKEVGALEKIFPAQLLGALVATGKVGAGDAGPSA